MNKFFRNLAIATLALAGFTAAANAQNTPAPIASQRARIRQGVRDGSLTRAEAQRLRRQEQQVRRQALRDRRDGAGLTRREAARLRANTRQNSRAIARLRHNNRTR
jgi:hypothetical protein